MFPPADSRPASAPDPDPDPRSAVRRVGVGRARVAGRRPSPVFWLIVAVFLGTGAALYEGVGGAGVASGVLIFAFVVAGWMISLCLHEYAHARAALHGGDTSVVGKGYLTLNPARYTHPLLSFVLPVAIVVIGGIGLPGGAVYIERHRIPGRLRHSLVSAVGPATNALFAVVLSVGLDVWAGLVGGLPASVAVSVAVLVMFQITATLLNLLPVPGLDGYGIVEPWLPERTRRAVAPYAPFGLLAVFALLWQPEVGRWFFTAVYWLMELTGMPAWLAWDGLEYFRFWTLSAG
ncbi:site-2 protease family protein [Allostreptomyces psammosilenae]|uniref:Zn-dependent protease n=1 Tax=Allostreptomyces psammosilenae TaxID=1892865 RepID=A0A853A1X3_9ACTN|nr:site-2 protease family protein [Allostreptomyces psammosilenae]NYI06894.1 Zn-dependent protease [Allostreptomyces psammosilenae]